jgi:hypothetical protein
MSKKSHHLRYVLRTDGLVYASIIDRATPVRFVIQPAPFRRIAGIDPDKTIGTVFVNDAQLLHLGVIPGSKREEVEADVRIAVLT